MHLRKSTIFLTLTALNLMLCLTLVLHARSRAANAGVEVRASRTLVAALGLTDLCLFTEARYTRHPSMSDRHAPFQDHPLAQEHFPTGSLVNPPVSRREAP